MRMLGVATPSAAKRHQALFGLGAFCVSGLLDSESGPIRRPVPGASARPEQNPSLSFLGNTGSASVSSRKVAPGAPTLGPLFAKPSAPASSAERIYHSAVIVRF